MHAGTQLSHRRLQRFQALVCLLLLPGLPSTVSRYLLNATVGFGDIIAKTEAARLVVTGQMIADLVVIGLGLKVIVGAVKRGRQQRPTGAAAAQSNE